VADQVRQMEQTLLLEPLIVVSKLERHVQDVVVLDGVHRDKLVFVAGERQHLDPFGEVLETELLVFNDRKTGSDPLAQFCQIVWGLYLDDDPKPIGGVVVLEETLAIVPQGRLRVLSSKALQIAPGEAVE